MDDRWIDSTGFCVGRWFFPPFTVGRGECVTLDLQKEALVDHDSIIETLTGSTPTTGLNLHATVAFAKPATSSTGWRRWFHDPTPFDWLKENTAMSEDVMRSILVEHGIDRHIPLSHYAGTPRLILGLHAVYAHKPDVIVFETSGLDPRGINDIYRIVSQHLTECAAVYLAWPFSTQGREQHVSFPGSLTVPIIHDAGVPTSRPNVATSN